MKCYFGGLIIKFKNVKDRTGVCNFSIPELGILFRTASADNDETTLDFTSLLSLFEFMGLNIPLFKNISSFDLYVSNSKLLDYIKGKEKVPLAFESVKSTIMFFINHNNHMQFNFFKVSKIDNAAFFKVNEFTVDMMLGEKMKKLAGGLNDSNKDRK